LNRLFRADRRLYLITDTVISGLQHIHIAHLAITAGIKTIQLREKIQTRREIYKEALLLRSLTRKHGATFFINDYVDIALLVDADGVHLGQEDMPIKEARRILGENKIIGISTHTLKQAIKAQSEGADYIGFGPIFHTTTKDAGRPKGIKALIEVKKHIKIPVVAIGGITLENAHEVLKAGADAIAVVSGILSGDIKANIKGFLSIIKGIKS